MKKLTVFAILGAFAFGCATASVIVNEATAAPTPGMQQCALFPVAAVTDKDVAAGKLDEKSTWLPDGWIGVGGASMANSGLPGVIACRTQQ